MWWLSAAAAAADRHAPPRSGSGATLPLLVFTGVHESINVVEEFLLAEVFIDLFPIFPFFYSFTGAYTYVEVV